MIKSTKSSFLHFNANLGNPKYSFSPREVMHSFLAHKKTIEEVYYIYYHGAILILWKMKNSVETQFRRNKNFRSSWRQLELTDSNQFVGMYLILMNRMIHFVHRLLAWETLCRKCISVLSWSGRYVVGWYR